MAPGRFSSRWKRRLPIATATTDGSLTTSRSFEPRMIRTLGAAVSDTKGVAEAHRSRHVGHLDHGLVRPVSQAPLAPRAVPDDAVLTQQRSSRRAPAMRPSGPRARSVRSRSRGR